MSIPGDWQDEAYNRLRQENERLRAALKQIADTPSWSSQHSNLAREALENGLELEAFFRERRKHRTMTWGEYMACGGDAISHPSDASAFPGGITIALGTPPIIGRTAQRSG